MLFESVLLPVSTVSFRFEYLFWVGRAKLLLVAACFAIFKPGSSPLALALVFTYLSFLLGFTVVKSISSLTLLALNLNASLMSLRSILKLKSFESITLLHCAKLLCLLP